MSVDGAIRRDPESAAAEPFDLIVVGAGIHGAAAALEASRRGLRVLVLDRGDFGGETSWSSLRILHGGLRYLQSFDLVRFRESVKARSWYVRELPSLVEPLVCLMPLYGEGPRRKTLLGPALALNELLRRVWAADSERDLIPGSRLLGATEVRNRFPAVRTTGLQGGALWHDAYVSQPQRVLIEMLRRVVSRGGSALNYVEATGWCLDDGNRILGVEARDLLTDTPITFASRAVLNCAGPWARGLDGANWPAGTESHAPSLAFNLLLDCPLDTASTVAVQPAGGGRTYFLHPMGTRTLAGTYHAAADGPGGTPSEAQISEFIGDLRAAIPGFAPARSDVLRVLAGTLPAKRVGTDDVETRDLWADAGARGGPEGLFTLVGVKYTTAPLAAKRAVKRIVQRCFPTVGGTGDGMTEPAPRPVPAWQEFADLARNHREQARVLVQAIVDNEGVTTVEDLLLRRVDWGLVPSEFDEAARLAGSWFPELVPGEAEPGSD